MSDDSCLEKWLEKRPTCPSCKKRVRRDQLVALFFPALTEPSLSPSQVCSPATTVSTFPSSLFHMGTLTVLAQRTLRDLERELLEERRMRNHCEAEASRWRAEAERLALLLAAKRPRTLGSSTPSTLSLSSPDGTPDAPASSAFTVVPEPSTVPEVSEAKVSVAEEHDDDGDDDGEKEEHEHGIMAGLRRSVAEALVVASDSQRTEGTNDGHGGHEEEEEEDVEALASSFRCFSVVELAVCVRDHSHT